MHEDSDQEIVGCTPTNLPRHGEIPFLNPILWVFMGKLSPQKSLENRINTYKYHGAHTYVRGTPNSP